MAAGQQPPPSRRIEESRFVLDVGMHELDRNSATLREIKPTE
jgi:hypothetical protein